MAFGQGVCKQRAEGGQYTGYIRRALCMDVCVVACGRVSPGVVANVHPVLRPMPQASGELLIKVP